MRLSAALQTDGPLCGPFPIFSKHPEFGEFSLHIPLFPCIFHTHSGLFSTIFCLKLILKFCGLILIDSFRLIASIKAAEKRLKTIDSFLLEKKSI